MIAAHRSLGTHGDPDLESRRRGAEESAPRLLRGTRAGPRGSSGWVLGAHVGRLGLALALGLGTAEARPLRASHLMVTPAPFGFDTLALACEFKNTRSAFVPGDSGSSGPALRLRYQFWISDDVTGNSWGSGWLSVPALRPGQEVRVGATLAMLPDPTSAGRITQITIALFLDEGGKARKVLKRHYHRWHDGRFRALPEYPAPPIVHAGRTPGPMVAEPQAAPLIIIVPENSGQPKPQRMTWGALKVKYRRDAAPGAAQTRSGT